MPSASSPGSEKNRLCDGFQALAMMPTRRPAYSNGFKHKDWSKKNISDKPACRAQGQPTSSRELFWRRRNFWFGFVLDGEQLHFKNERRAGANARTRVRSAISISEVRGNKELPLRSYRHDLESLSPAFNDARHGE